MSSDMPLKTSYRPMTIIVAATMKNGIGVNGGLPWRLPGEMKYFARVTTGEGLASGEENAVIMGRKTWDGIPDKFRPLKGRRNLIISRSPESIDLSKTQQGLRTSKHGSVAEALDTLPSAYDAPSTRGNRIFLIGGSQIYTQCLASSSSSSSLVDRILLTRVIEPAFDECDVFLPDFAAQEDWQRSTHGELVEWVGWDVPEGVVEEKGVKYRYEMWARA
ncbi:hypothetical protein NliqN6_3768 [Naganishia liquefaciens]|uniref:Dihydrofolate reductase n=1 Tax=Naganishia liquefaciens TaxID=104408 RepID=A0A8H3TUV6_9TREE|nr:hypothetical protein NliqN6_3768 [Naganishia liquefaciens]